MDDADLVRRLADIEEIKGLKARYFRMMDRKDWDGLARVFATDGRMEVPDNDVDVRGADAIAAFLSEVLDGVRTVHHGHMPEIEVTGPDTARGIWAMFDYVEFPTAADGTRSGLRGYGHYTEEYVRQDGEWRIQHLYLSRIRIDSLDD